MSGKYVHNLGRYKVDLTIVNPHDVTISLGASANGLMTIKDDNEIYHHNFRRIYGNIFGIIINKDHPWPPWLWDTPCIHKSHGHVTIYDDYRNVATFDVKLVEFFEYSEGLVIRLSDDADQIGRAHV